MSHYTNEEVFRRLAAVAAASLLVVLGMREMLWEAMIEEEVAVGSVLLTVNVGHRERGSL